jgi:hypothetical protein
VEQIALFSRSGRWHRVSPTDARARALVDRHYSRQTPGAIDFLPPGKKFCLLTDDERAVWGVCENRDPAGRHRWRVTVFRNEGAGLSSSLIAEATRRTFDFWIRHYSGLPSVPLQTEVAPDRVRKKRDPGRCFLRAGWRVVRTIGPSHGRPSIVVLEASANQWP